MNILQYSLYSFLYAIFVFSQVIFLSFLSFKINSVFRISHSRKYGFVKFLMIAITNFFKKNNWQEKDDIRKISVGLFSSLMLAFLILAAFSQPIIPPFAVRDSTSYLLQKHQLVFSYFFILAATMLFTVKLWNGRGFFEYVVGHNIFKTIISIELTFLISLLALIIEYNTIDFSELIAKQREFVLLGNFGSIKSYGIVLQPIGFVVIVFTSFARLSLFNVNKSKAFSMITNFEGNFKSDLNSVVNLISYLILLLVTSFLIVILFLGGWSMPYFGEYLDLQVNFELGTLAYFLMISTFYLKIFLIAAIFLLFSNILSKTTTGKILEIIYKFIYPLALINLCLVLIKKSGIY